MAGRPPYETTDVMPYGAGPGRLRPPDCLGELQRKAFVDLIAACPINQFTRADLQLLARWAELVVLAEQASFEMQEGGMVVETAQGYRASPWFGIHRDACRELRALSQRLQIGPRARSPRAPKTRPGAVSYYDRMDLLEGDGDDAH
jgi:hypothetical protein